MNTQNERRTVHGASAGLLSSTEAITSCTEQLTCPNVKLILRSTRESRWQYISPKWITHRCPTDQIVDVRTDVWKLHRASAELWTDRWIDGRIWLETDSIRPTINQQRTSACIISLSMRFDRKWHRLIAFENIFYFVSTTRKFRHCMGSKLMKPLPQQRLNLKTIGRSIWFMEKTFRVGAFLNTQKYIIIHEYYNTHTNLLTWLY